MAASPKAELDDTTLKAAPVDSAAALLPLVVLQNRSDFLRAARAKRVPCGAFLLQARKRDETEPGGLRVGFTCSKKVGNAVIRNRAKRRLREIARAELPRAGLPGWDYVLVGRADRTISEDFAKMRADLNRALKKIHGAQT